MASKDRTSCYGEDYETKFDISAFLASRTDKAKASGPFFDVYWALIDKWIETFASATIKGQRLLEFGCGPSINTVIPSSRCFDEIYMCEYAAQCRQAVQDWVDKKPSAHDWTPFLKYAAGKEGGGITSNGLATRVREKITQISPCNVHLENMFEPHHFQPAYFDCIISNLTLEAACNTDEDYKRVIRKLSGLLKPGGYLFLSACFNKSVYPVGDEIFYAFNNRPQLLKDALREAGFVDEEIIEFSKTSSGAYIDEPLAFVTATKSHDSAL